MRRMLSGFFVVMALFCSACGGGADGGSSSITLTPAQERYIVDSIVRSNKAIVSQTWNNTRSVEVFAIGSTQFCAGDMSGSIGTSGTVDITAISGDLYKSTFDTEFSYTGCQLDDADEIYVIGSIGSTGTIDLTAESASYAASTDLVGTLTFSTQGTFEVFREEDSGDCSIDIDIEMTADNSTTVSVEVSGKVCGNDASMTYTYDLKLNG